MAEEPSILALRQELSNAARRYGVAAEAHRAGLLDHEGFTGAVGALTCRQCDEGLS